MVSTMEKNFDNKLPTPSSTTREFDLPSQLSPQPSQQEFNSIYSIAQQLNIGLLNRRQTNKPSMEEKNRHLCDHQSNDIDLEEFHSALSLSPVFTTSAFNVFKKNSQGNTDIVCLSRLGESVKSMPSTASLQVLMSPTQLRRSSGLPFLETRNFMNLTPFETVASLTTSLEETPTDCYENYASNSNIFAGDYRIYWQLTEIYLKRLKNIGSDVANRSREVKLNKSNTSIISNIEELESQVYKRLDCLRNKVKIDNVDVQRNCCKDTDPLLKIVQSVCHQRNSDIQDILSKTISRPQIFSDINSQIMRVKVGRIERYGRTIDSKLRKKSTVKEFGRELLHMADTGGFLP
uniref:Uncharacterized protein n=1 Tax=Glossina brevipalpis TaxID=37001 RepID=A0A1A9X536_9MUSC